MEICLEESDETIAKAEAILVPRATIVNSSALWKLRGARDAMTLSLINRVVARFAARLLSTRY
jgi:hypothetical protein